MQEKNSLLHAAEECVLKTTHRKSPKLNLPLIKIAKALPTNLDSDPVYSAHK